jgi:hypothetical protein
VKYRTKKITRMVPHTVGADTRYVEVTDTIDIPVTPLDWDRIVLSGVSVVAVFAIVAGVAWSTASIGSLLSLAVPPVIGYGAASIFDAAWITCLAVEWLSRYNTAKAVLPRNIGYGALLVAMAAVGVHGAITGNLAVGIVGALISGIAKVIWTVVLHHNAKPLDARTQQWVNQYSAEAGAQLAMVTVNRQLARAKEGFEGAHVPVITTAEDSAGQARAAVLAALDTMPGASTEDIVNQLAMAGITVTADLVDEVSGQPQDTRDSSSERSITDLVRDLTNLGVRDRDTVVAAVRTSLGAQTNPASVIRIFNRITNA